MRVSFEETARIIPEKKDEAAKGGAGTPGPLDQRPPLERKKEDERKGKGSWSGGKKGKDKGKSKNKGKGRSPTPHRKGPAT